MDAPTDIGQATLPRAAALTHLHPGMQLLYDGNKLATVPDEVVAAFQPGDRLLVVGHSGDVLHVPQAQHERATEAVDRASRAFAAMGAVPDEAITRFYRRFAARLGDGAIWARIASANERDIFQARARGRSTIRLAATERMRAAMIAGLGEWERLRPRRGLVTETTRHDGWRVEQLIDGLGVVGFVFEGRPNVFADATGILRGGNTAVLRIGSDALGTARAITAEALLPALREAGLPEGAITLLESAERASGWALFSDPRLALAVARGSGPAVAQLGAIARQAGIPASLHGTGGAWLIADRSADRERLRAAIYHSTDRKVCNTANVILLPRASVASLMPAVLAALEARGEANGHGYKLHVAAGTEPYIPAALFAAEVPVLRAEGVRTEPLAERLAIDDLGHEWEWEATPELSLAVADDLDEAVALFNRYSPRFAASLIAEDPAAHDRFFRAVDAPFVGDGFTRWVDGQYALDRPELGLANWQSGRLFGRGGILSGEGVFTVRLRMRQDEMDLHR